ncbi:Phospholipid-transporting ATPase [Mycena kentingensis (nom. inval.)]|nr:Phospholipid-transporting ATPase [Mycena kentingensis (nom. inval.)]
MAEPPWYRRLSTLKLEDLFSSRRLPGPPRTVHVNQDLPPDYLEPNGKVKPAHIYASNQVVTSKYTILTFLPRSLIEQFRRVANLFFLSLAILQFFPKFSTLSVGVVERQMNPQVLINLLFLFLMAVACAIGDSVLEHRYQPLNAPWLYGDDTSSDNPSLNGLITWAFAFLTFQLVVPISLYISMEVVRTFQAAFIFFDKEMWYAKTDQATLAKSWNLSDDLGQIEYIFSDKTGTLTQNLMVFRQCSVGGRAYTGEDDAESLKEGKDVSSSKTHLSDFANSGLRTLTLAYKVIQEDEYLAWNERYHEATVALEDREDKVEAVSEELERDLRLLGATAIEDKLQDGVPETIADLKRAGIKIWVATGDKLETAIAIGKSTNLINPDSNIIIIRGGNDRGRTIHQQMQFAIDTYFPDSDRAIQHSRRSTSSRRSAEPGYPLERVETGVTSIVGEDNGERPGGFVLVVDGTALGHAFDDADSKALLLQLGTMLVKDGLGSMTLAIGDGANDVSMIQAADVGVGISGEEGLQAANSSDYAIAQFRFLKKLLLVHGHWSYARNGTMILNFFYKNIVPTGVLFWFQIYNGWSGTYYFAYVYVLFWNSLWTLLPVVAIGVFDRFLDSHALMAVPELYHFGREGHWFNLRSFAGYIIDGLYQSAIVFWFLHFTYITTSSRPDGWDSYINEASTTMALSAAMVANMYTGLTATAWTFWLFFALAFGITVIWGFTAIYSIISPGYAVTVLYGNHIYVLRSAYFWFGMLLTVILAFTPRYLFKAWKGLYQPNDMDTVRWITLNDKDRDLQQLHTRGRALAAMKPRPPSVAASRASRRTSSIMTLERPRISIDFRSASTTDMATGLVSVDRGFDFATEEGGVALRRMQTNLSEKRASNRNLAVPENKAKGRMSFRRGLRSLTRKSRDDAV